MFERLELIIGKDVLEYIKKKKILLIGCGGVGGMCAVSLIRSGITNITIADYDTVDISNLNRQIVAYQDTMGKKKVNILKNIMLNINPAVNVFENDAS